MAFRARAITYYSRLIETVPWNQIPGKELNCLDDEHLGRQRVRISKLVATVRLPNRTVKTRRYSMINPSVAASSHPPTGQKLGYDATLAALTIATMPARAPGAVRARQSRRRQYPPAPPQGFPWRTIPPTPPRIRAFRPPKSPYCIVRLKSYARPNSDSARPFFQRFKMGKQKPPGAIPGGFMSEVWKPETPDEAN